MYINEGILSAYNIIINIIKTVERNEIHTLHTSYAHSPVTLSGTPVHLHICEVMLTANHVTASNNSKTGQKVWVHFYNLTSLTNTGQLKTRKRHFPLIFSYSAAQHGYNLSHYVIMYFLDAVYFLPFSH